MLQKSLILTLVAGLGLSACTIPGIGNSPALQGVNSIQEARALVQNGMSMEQVRAKLGEPRSVQTQNNQTRWGYAAGTGTFGPASLIGLGGVRTDIRAVIITFSPSGRVSAVDYNRTSR